ncbi:DUF3164 family protein [Tenacibaculum maritimum]|uniref:DUF3164 family protein n=1 Tax=Tenacibaculum maritimum TaxID=107401 RepID=UPI00387625EA
MNNLRINLSEISESELKAALKQKKEARNNDRKAYKDLVKQELPEALQRLKNLSDHISLIKTEVFTGLQALLEMKKEVFGIKDNQQSHTFSIENGDSLTLGYRVTDGWDDTVNEGIAKVSEFIGSLAKDENSAKLVATINKLLKKDAKGNLKANRVVELQNLADEFDNDSFNDGVEIILKAYKPQKSCYFIDATTIDMQGKKQNIPLSISSVGFKEGANVQFSSL